MPSDQNEYEIFISYARLDNKPIPPDNPCGWVTALRDHILADQRRYSTEPLRIFFDTSEIKDMDDWRHRILGALRSSKILLVCLSPNYFNSNPCRWEWDEYLKRQTHQLMGADSIATVYFAEVPGTNEQENAKRLAELIRGNFTDLRPWFPAGPRMLLEAEVHRRLEALGLSLWDRIERARRARGVPGNVRRTNPFFVGRREELRRLHEQLGVGAIGVVTAVHGLGGQGKTELAYHYANGFADWYPGGLWSLGAEGKKELLPLLGELAFVPQFAYEPSDAEKADANRLGQAVLEELRKRCAKRSEPERQREAAALIILDNVSEPELLSATELASLPHPANWLRLVATTRLGPERLAKSGKQLATVPVDSLDEEDAITLIRDHQPNQQFPNNAEESAAREIVHALGGFTLAVEQVAVYLGLNAPDELPSAFRERLRKDGLPRVDQLPKDAEVAAQMLHQQKQLAPILRSTIESLVRELPAAGTALKYAADLPPDSVPWPWLKELTATQHPEIADQPVAWAKIKRRLEGFRLLISGDQPEIARVHRLVAAHLIENWKAEKVEETRKFVLNRCLSINESQGIPSSWELDGLLLTILFLLEKSPEPNLAMLGMLLTDQIILYRSLVSAQNLLEKTHLVILKFADLEPANEFLQHGLESSFIRLGDVALAQGNLAESERFFVESLRATLGLRKSDSGNAQGQPLPSRIEMPPRCYLSLIKLGDVTKAKGDLAMAGTHFLHALSFIEQLAESDPGDIYLADQMSGCCEKLGDVAFEQGNLPSAQSLYTNSLKIRENLVEFDPANLALKRNLSVSFARLGRVAEAQGNLAEARRLFLDSLLTIQDLAKSDPGNFQKQEDLAVSLNLLGDVVLAQGDLREAKSLFAKSHEIRQHLVESEPSNARWQRDLTLSLDKLGDVTMIQGNLPEAQRIFDESFQICQRLAKSDPGNIQWQHDLSVGHCKIARLLEKQGSEKARDHWRQAHDILAAMVQAGLSLSPEDLETLKKLQGKIAGPTKRTVPCRCCGELKPVNKEPCPHCQFTAWSFVAFAYFFAILCGGASLFWFESGTWLTLGWITCAFFLLGTILPTWKNFQALRKHRRNG